MLEELLEQYPTDTAVVNNLAVAYLSLKRPDDARTILLRGLEAEPDEYLTHNNMVAALLDLGDLPTALRHAEEAIRLGPTIGRPYFAKATVLNQLGRTDEALTAYRRCAELDPSFPRVHIALGQLLNGQGEWQEALASWETVVKLQPQSWSNQYNLGLAYARVGRLDEAASVLRVALGLDPGNARVERALERALAEEDGG